DGEHAPEIRAHLHVVFSEMEIERAGGLKLALAAAAFLSGNQLADSADGEAHQVIAVFRDVQEGSGERLQLAARAGGAAAAVPQRVCAGLALGGARGEN